MDDTFDSIIACCNFSSSQEDLLMHSLFAREDELFPFSSTPEPYPPSPSTAANVAGNGIVICSAPETPISDTAASPPAEEFKTPPDESRRSNSEVPAPPQQSLCARGGEADGSGFDGCRGIADIGTGCGVSDGAAPDLEFSQVEKRSPESDGRLRVVEVAKVDFESFRVGGNRGREKQSPIEDPSPSKRVRVSGEFSGLSTNPSVAMEEVVVSGVKVKKATPLNWVAPGSIVTWEASGSDHEGGSRRDEEGECLTKRGLKFPVEMEMKVKLETEESDGDFRIGEDDQKIDTEEIEDYYEEEDSEKCANSKEIFTAKSPQKEDEGKKKGNGNKDLNREGKRELPSWVYPQEDKGEGNENGKRNDENRLNTEQTVSTKMGALLDVLALLARELRRYHDNDSVDFLETAKRRGMTFPEPKWWHDNDDDEVR